MHLSCDQFTYHSPMDHTSVEVELRFLGGSMDGLSRRFIPVIDKTYQLFRHKGVFYRISGLEIYCKEPHVILVPASEEEILEGFEFVEVK